LPEYVFLQYNNRSLDSGAIRINGKGTSFTHVIGLVGTEGPVFEMWIDADGKLVRWRGNCVEMKASNKEEIGKKWGEQLESLRPDEPVAGSIKKIKVDASVEVEGSGE